MKANRVLLIGSALLAVLAGVALAEDKPVQNDATKPPAVQKLSPSTLTTAPKPASDFPVIGYIEKRGRIITIKAGPKGPIYSVKTTDGKVLFENLSAEQLRAQAPELQEFLKTALAGASGKGPAADARVRPIADGSVR